MSVSNPKVKTNTKPELHGKTERAGLGRVYLEQVYVNEGHQAHRDARKDAASSGKANPGKWDGRKPTENSKTLEMIRLRAETHHIARHELESLKPEDSPFTDDAHEIKVRIEPEFEEMNRIDRESRGTKEITYEGVNLESLWTPWVASGDRFGKVKESSHTRHHAPLPDSGMRKNIPDSAYRAIDTEPEFMPANPTVRNSVPREYWLDMALKSLQF